MPPIQASASETNSRPPVAIGHVRLMVSDVPVATEFFLKLGLRSIHQSEGLAILELRGGTHLVLRVADMPIQSQTKAPFDLMVDDVAATHLACLTMGMKAGEIETGRIHSSFTLIGPDEYVFTVTSSHTSGRAV